MPAPTRRTSRAANPSSLLKKPSAVIPTETGYGSPSHVLWAMNPSSIKMPRKERFLTSQTPFGMTNSGFFSNLLGLLGSRRGVFDHGHKNTQDIRNTEGLLQGVVSAQAATAALVTDDVAGHEDDFRTIGARGDPETLSDAIAIGVGAGAGQLQITEDGVELVAEDEAESLFGGSGTFDLEAVRGEAFGEKHADALFIVEHENRAIPQERERFGFAGVGARIGGARGGNPGPLGRGRERDGEGSAPRGQRFGFNVAAMLAEDGHADTQAKTGAATWTLGGEKGIKDSGQGFRLDADAVILNGGKNAVQGLAQANLDAAGLAKFPNGLFRIADEIEEDLNELVGVTGDGRKTGERTEVDFDVVAAQGMLVQLEGAVDDVVEVEHPLLRRSGAREFQKVLHDAGGAACLTVSHFELALGAIVDALAIAKQFANAENGGERIVQFVSDAGEHLAHGGEFFSLDELLFEALELGNVAARDDHALDLAVFIEERAEVAAKAAPLALFVAHLDLDGSKAAASGEHIVQDSKQGGAFVPMGALAEGFADGLGVFITEDFLDPGAGKGVALVGIHHEDQVGEAVNEAASEFLFLVKALFNGAALGDINYGPLIADDAAAGIANDGGGVQAKERLAILAAKCDLVALRRGLMIDFVNKGVALLLVDEDVADVLAEESFLRVVAQHADERGIHLEDLILGGNDVDAFLERFKEFREAGFAAADGGDVAGENGEAVDLVIAEHGVSDAIEEIGGVGALDANLNDTGPVAAFEKPGHRLGNGFRGSFVNVLDELHEMATDDFLEGAADEIGEAAID